MIDILAGLSLAAAGVPADLGTTDLPQLFISACLDGEAHLTANEASPIQFGQLPRELQKRLNAPASSQVWRLNAPGRAFLYVLDSASGTGSRVCGLASDSMDYRAAARKVERRVMGDVYPEQGKSFEWTDPHGEYVAVATHAGDFDVLQTRLPSPEERAAVARKYGRLNP